MANAAANTKLQTPQLKFHTTNRYSSCLSTKRIRESSLVTALQNESIPAATACLQNESALALTANARLQTNLRIAPATARLQTNPQTAPAPACLQMNPRIATAATATVKQSNYNITRRSQLST